MKLKNKIFKILTGKLASEKLAKPGQDWEYLPSGLLLIRQEYRLSNWRLDQKVYRGTGFTDLHENPETSFNLEEAEVATDFGVWPF
ncbi:MAG: hypothetical protein SRB2_03664 [Desulfobacteraceae bacterium Eth-SRB2]|nr:MAG: hypothetical protein SRB2_03664 [Desulfobacteraceae bacterium Eth-SRB2]